eukprot:scaffold402054_cov44-Prasinocladus_malaysianus.AAC.1
MELASFCVCNGVSYPRTSSMIASRAASVMQVRDAGVQQLQLALQIACFQIWLLLSYNTEGYGMAMWALRFVVLVMLLSARDKPIDFEDLEKSDCGCGMGLL